MMHETVELTPSQHDFCVRSIPGFRKEEWRVTVAGRAGSDRCFFRITPLRAAQPSKIVVVWDSRDEDWRRFITIHREVAGFLPLLPAIYSVDEKHGLILEEDCGAQTLKDFCEKNDAGAAVEEKYREVIDLLVQWQRIGRHEAPEIGTRVLDTEMFLWETDYFARYCVRDYCGLEAMLDAEWERDRERLAHEASGLPVVPIHRDFQSENIMIRRSDIKLVDYQGARLGCAEYDLASLLYDPYVTALSETMRGCLLEYYIATSGRPVTHHTFFTAVLQRLCQALGAYGNLSLHKGRERYRAFIPRALQHLMAVSETVSRYPRLGQIAEACFRKIRRS